MAMTAQQEVAKLRELEERIKAPSIWGRVPCGLRFEDLQDRRYEEACRFLKKYYLPEEITYRSVKLHEDKEGSDEFIHNAKIWMKDKMSIAAIKEGTDKLVGMLIIRIQEKQSFSRTFSRVKVTHDPLYSTVMKFYNQVEAPVDLYHKMNVRRYFKIYLVALKNRYRHRGVSKEMIKAAIALAKSANVPAIAGIFTTGRAQQIADELGFLKLNEIYYNKYLVDKEMVFYDTGLGNYGAALWGLRIAEVEEPEEVKPIVSSRFKIDMDEDTDDPKANAKADQEE